MLLFEWGRYDDELHVQFVRQFGLEEEEGGVTYEQVGCSLVLADVAPREGPPFEVLWSGEDLARWFQEVEQNAVFNAVMAISGLTEVVVTAGPV